jgi:hypothetical protein
MVDSLRPVVWLQNMRPLLFAFIASVDVLVQPGRLRGEPTIR